VVLYNEFDFELSSGSDVIDNKVEHEMFSEAETAWAQREWSIQHVLFPSMRLFFKPPASMATDGTFVQVIHVCFSLLLKNINQPLGNFRFSSCKSHPPCSLSPL